MAVGNTGNVKAPSRYISWSVPSATVAVGETTNVSYTSASSADPVKENLESLLNGLATVEIDATNNVVTFTGVSAGTVNLASDSPVGPSIYSNSFSLTVTAPVEDESYLNKRGLTHFWENINTALSSKANSSDVPAHGTIASGNTGYVTGGDVYTAIGNIETLLASI